MKNLVLFGRSPFVNKIDRQKIIDNNITIGLNYFAANNAVDFSFCWDKYIRPMSCVTTTFYHFEAPTVEDRNAIQYRPIISREPFPIADFVEGKLRLAFLCFIATAAINWAILMRKKALYLVGIDHVETDKRFIHNDNIDDEYGQNMNQEIHKTFKNYVYAATKYIDIYQTNPAVKDDWNLPFVEVESLYV